MYNHIEIEKKWQEYWEKNKTFKTYNPINGKQINGEQNVGLRPKYYCLDMFPYPSGAGLHVGHPEGYTANDIVARYKNAKGFNVLHPMGWDAFGLPAENYAIKTGTHPRITTDKNIDNIRKQIKSLGISYDWDREVDTTDPKYYKWTQWIFLKLFENGLAYEQDLPINYCPSCKTGLANEEVLNDFTCERCGTKVEQKKIRQWVLAITKYADRLLHDVDKLDWPEGIKDMQRNWIGRSEGINIEYKVCEIDEKITCYTTRPDTNFGMTFLTLAPEHELIEKYIDKFPNKDEVKKYVKMTKSETEITRMVGDRKKTGVFTGFHVISNLTGEKIPLYVGDFVLAHVGTGALVGVPGHDLRDFEFAKAMGIEIKRVVVASDGDISEINKKEQVQEEEGTMINSDFLNGLKIMEAKEKIMDYMEKKGFGKRVVNYKLRDWLFSRQRYWGEPIPLIHLEMEQIKNLEKIEAQKKEENCHSRLEGVTRNGDTTKFSSIYSIFENIIKVKRKIGKNEFNELYGEIKTEKGIIIFNGKYLKNHFSIKKRREFEYRKRFGETIIKNLNNIIYETDLLGYIVVYDMVFRIVLEKLGEKKYNLKTYYSTLKYTKIYNKAYILLKDPDENSDSKTICKCNNKERFLIIKGKVFSKIYDGLYGKIVCDYKLPLELPEVEKYEPSGDGTSPLTKVDSFVNIKLAENLTGKRETNTMPQWGGSCWYYLRYMDNLNENELVSKEAVNYWGEVDSYVGGAEHAVLHLLYARFWHKFLFDIGVVPTDEPFYRLRNQGLILAHAFKRQNGGLLANDLVKEKGGKFYEIETKEEVDRIISKMSKSLKNVINPDDIVKEYGADSLRLYEMYMAEFKDTAPWDTKGIIGVRRFLDKVDRLFSSESKISRESDVFTEKLLHKTIKKVGEDIENYKFNTAIASMMILVNNGLPKNINKQIEWKNIFLRLLHPFAPHLAEELWELIDDITVEFHEARDGLIKVHNSIFFANWPEYDEKIIIDDTVVIGVQVLGKLRGEIKISKDENKDSVLKKAKENHGVAKWLNGKEIVKEIYIPGKIVNIIIK